MRAPGRRSASAQDRPEPEPGLLAKAARRATTAIEGNTLSEEQVRQQMDGTLHLPPSKQYLGQEVQNIIEAFNGLWAEILGGQPFALTVDRICAFNAQVLNKLETTPEVRPGAIRSHSVGVMGYRGAPAEDCRYLLHHLVDWLNDPSFQPDAEHGSSSPFWRRFSRTCIWPGFTHSGTATAAPPA